MTVHRHQAQSWRQTGLGEHFQRRAFVVQQSIRYPE